MLKPCIYKDVEKRFFFLISNFSQRKSNMIDTLKLIRQVNQSELTPSQKLTLIACIYKVNWRTWQADYPISIQSLSDECRLSKATVKRSLKALEDEGYITRDATSYKGGQGASHLQVNPLKLSNDKGAQLEPRGGVNLSLGGDQIEPRGAQIEPHIYPIYSKPNISIEQAHEKEKDSPFTTPLSMQEYLKQRMKEQEKWEIKRKEIVR